jgi:hypothetical protein
VLIPDERQAAMKESPENIKPATSKRAPLAWKQCAIVAAIVAVIQAFLTINGRGIVGFILWVIIIFVFYWILFTFLIWLWRRLRDHA